MSHIKDLWWGEEPDPDNPKKMIRFKKPGFGKGMRYKVVWTPPGEKETSKSFPDGKKREAQAFQTAIDDSILDRRYVDPKIGRKPFVEVWDEWFKGTSPDPNSRRTHKSQFDSHIEPFFRGKSIEAAARPEVVTDWLEWLTGRRAYGHPLSDFYKVILFREVSGVFRLAHGRKYITENPCTSDRVTRPRAPKKQIIPWARSRMDQVWDALDERNKLVVPLGAGQGLRQGEILAVSPDDFDRANMMLNVQRQVRRLPGNVRVFSLPKGNKTRQVPLAQWTLDHLDAHMKQFPPQRVTLPWKTADGHPETVELVLVRPDGLPWYGELFHNTVWSGAFRDADLIRRKQVDGMHALRHLYASQQLAGGVSIRELAEYLGHADAKTTLTVYTHLMPSSAHRSRMVTDMWIDPTKPQTAQIRPGIGVEDDGDLYDENGEITDVW